MKNWSGKRFTTEKGWVGTPLPPPSLFMRNRNRAVVSKYASECSGRLSCIFQSSVCLSHQYVCNSYISSKNAEDVNI